MENQIVHSHTTLVDSLQTHLTFRKRIEIKEDGIPVDVNINAVLEARLRGTELRFRENLVFRIVHVKRALLCNATWDFCDAMHATCQNPNCQCDTPGQLWSWKGDNETGECKLTCTNDTTCKDVFGRWSFCSQPRPHREGQCECLQGTRNEGRQCVRKPCRLEEYCGKEHGPSFCSNDSCVCLAGHVLTDGRCARVPCLSNDECPELHLQCLGGWCVCSHDYDRTEERCRKSQVR